MRSYPQFDTDFVLIFPTLDFGPLDIGLAQPTRHPKYVASDVRRIKLPRRNTHHAPHLNCQRATGRYSSADRARPAASNGIKIRTPFFACQVGPTFFALGSARVSGAVVGVSLATSLSGSCLGSPRAAATTLHLPIIR